MTTMLTLNYCLITVITICLFFYFVYSVRINILTFVADYTTFHVAYTARFLAQSSEGHLHKLTKLQGHLKDEEDASDGKILLLSL